MVKEFEIWYDDSIVELGGFIIMGSIGWTELIVILVAALLIFGPGKLPEVGATLGKALREFKGAVNNIDADIKKEVNVIKSEVRDIKSEVNFVKDAVDVKGAMKDLEKELKEVVTEEAPKA